MVCIAIRAVEVSLARSQDLFVGISASNTCRFSYTEQLLTSRDVEVNP